MLPCHVPRAFQYRARSELVPVDGDDALVAAACVEVLAERRSGHVPAVAKDVPLDPRLQGRRQTVCAVGSHRLDACQGRPDGVDSTSAQRVTNDELAAQLEAARARSDDETRRVRAIHEKHQAGGESRRELDRDGIGVDRVGEHHAQVCRGTVELQVRDAIREALSLPSRPGVHGSREPWGGRRGRQRDLGVAHVGGDHASGRSRTCERIGGIQVARAQMQLTDDILEVEQAPTPIAHLVLMLEADPSLRPGGCERLAREPVTRPSSGAPGE